MTKDKIRKVLKRFPYYTKMIREGRREAQFYIAKKTERFTVDREVETIVEIVEEIHLREQPAWLKRIVEDLQKGKKDISIMVRSPLSKGKYYFVKEKLIDKIYDCCIHKGLVSYEEILEEEIE